MLNRPFRPVPTRDGYSGGHHRRAERTGEPAGPTPQCAGNSPAPPFSVGYMVTIGRLPRG